MKPQLFLSALLGLTSVLAFASSTDQTITIQVGSAQAGTATAAIAGHATVDASVMRSAPVLDADSLDLRQAGSVQMEVFGMPLQVARDELQVRSGGWTWEGSGEDGSWLLLTSQEGRLAGTIDLDGREFEIAPQADGSSLLLERDLTLLPPPGQPLVPELPPELPPVTGHPPPAEGDHALRSGVHWIDVMIVYTSNVQVEAGGHAGVAARAHNDVAWTNRAFMNTAMPVRFRLVAVKRMSLTEDPDMDDMLPATRGNSQVNNWRNQYGADMVGVYVSQGQYCGLGYVMRNPGPTFERSAYQVTRFNCGAATYAHEHGHNMGMEHNPDNASASPSEASYPWSFGHGVAAGGNSFRTIMAYAAVCNGDPCPRIRSFSATGYIYNDIPIGVANSSENSRTGSLTAPVVAAFRPSVMLFQNGFDYGFID